MSILEEAIIFATEAHKNQRRKFDNSPYIRHPLSVMGMMTEFSNDPAVLAACVLHDTVEDCADITLEVIHERFGEIVAGYVFYVTEKAQKSDGIRVARKNIDKKHYSRGTAVSQNIKIIDALDNVPSMFLYDPKFAIIYTGEKLNLLDSLDKCNKVLYNRATDLFVRMLNKNFS